MANPDSPAPGTDLTPGQFDVLLQRLDADRNRAGEKYEEMRWRLVRFFQWNNCLAAEELVDEVFNRVAEKLSEKGDQIPDVAAFAWGVAKNVRQEALRNDLKTVPLADLPNEEGFVPMSRDSVDSESEITQRRLKFLRICIQRLSAQDRKLLLTYHAPKGRRIEERQRLASENALSMLALRVRASRLRFRLEECIKARLAAART
jgi:hypothetical protein